MKLHTSLSVAQCQARLASSTDAVRLAISWSGYAGSKEILGKIRGTGFRLQKRRNYRNSFAPLFYGQFIGTDDGTTIEGEFRMHRFTRVFIVCWFSFIGLFDIAVLALISRGEPGALAGGTLLLLSSGVLAAFGVGLLKFGQRLAHGEQQVILSFLRSTFETADRSQN